jgi:hypothetical protein
MKWNDVSPLAGIASGKGAMGDLAGKGLMGAVPYFIAKDAQKDDEAESAAAAEAEAELAKKSPQGYKKGGSVRGSGCATKGVKKCKIC